MRLQIQYYLVTTANPRPAYEFVVPILGSAPLPACIDASTVQFADTAADLHGARAQDKQYVAFTLHKKHTFSAASPSAVKSIRRISSRGQQRDSGTAVVALSPAQHDVYTAPSSTLRAILLAVFPDGHQLAAILRREFPFRIENCMTRTVLSFAVEAHTTIPQPVRQFLSTSNSFNGPCHELFTIHGNIIFSPSPSNVILMKGVRNFEAVDAMLNTLFSGHAPSQSVVEHHLVRLVVSSSTINRFVSVGHNATLERLAPACSDYCMSAEPRTEDECNTICFVISDWPKFSSMCDIDMKPSCVYVTITRRGRIVIRFAFSPAVVVTSTFLRDIEACSLQIVRLVDSAC